MSESAYGTVHPAHLRSKTDQELADLRRSLQEAEDRAQASANRYSKLVTQVIAEQNRRL